VPAPTHLLLVRHGQSEWNAQGRWQGQANPPLTNLGRLQARRAADALGTPDAVVASDLSRAAETAVIISQALGVGPVLTDERLRERDVGAWSGLTRDEIEARWPGDLAAWRTPEGFEHDADVVQRVQPVLQELAEQYAGGMVLVVTHGGVVRAFTRELHGVDTHLQNLSAQWFVADGGKLRLGEALELIDHDAVVAAHEVSEQDLA
jgi:broad specificity phosphatase PhoE